METRDSNRVQDEDELRPHYQFDYSKAKPSRFAGRFDEGTVAVVLEPDVAAVFPDAKAVNEALRLVMQLARIPRPEPSTVAEPGPADKCGPTRRLCLDDVRPSQRPPATWSWRSQAPAGTSPVGPLIEGVLPYARRRFILVSTTRRTGGKPEWRASAS